MATEDQEYEYSSLITDVDDDASSQSLEPEDRYEVKNIKVSMLLNDLSSDWVWSN